jgi:hypothetical protein
VQPIVPGLGLTGLTYAGPGAGPPLHGDEATGYHGAAPKVHNKLHREVARHSPSAKLAFAKPGSTKTRLHHTHAPPLASVLRGLPGAPASGPDATGEERAEQRGAGAGPRDQRAAPVGGAEWEAKRTHWVEF